MANLLKPWLGATMERELGDAPNSDRCSDDGSNIHIDPDSSQLGSRFVQLKEFIPFRRLIANLSDGECYCCATFSDEFLAEFQDNYKRPFTELTGCLFQITKFKIEVGRSGRPERLLSLSIGSMKWMQGRVGELTYGNPCSILSKSQIKQLMKALQDKNDETNQTQDQSTNSAPEHRTLGDNTQTPASSPISRSRASSDRIRSIARSSPQASAQRTPLPRTAGSKEPFHGNPVHQNEPGIQQGYGGESSEEDIGLPKQKRQGDTSVHTVEITSESGEQSQNSLAEHPIRRRSKSKGNSQAISMDSVPWVGAEISRSLTKVPNDQQALLDRRESWFPPEPGQRFPTANIPLRTLQQLNAAVEKQISRNQQTSQVSGDGLQGQDVAIISDDDAGNHGDSEIGSEPGQSEIASEDWPSSPPRNAMDTLPPDSSAPVSSVEVPTGLLKSPPILQTANKQQPVDMIIDSDGPDPPQIGNHESLLQSRPPDQLHSSSSSEESVIAYTPPQGVEKESVTNAQIPRQSASNLFKKPSSGISKLGPTEVSAKRPAKSPPSGIPSKRVRVPQSVYRKSLSLEPSLPFLDPEPEDSRVLDNLPKSQAQSKTVSPMSVLSGSAQASSNPTLRTPSAHPTHSVRSVYEGNRDAHEARSTQSALFEGHRVSGDTSHIDLSKSTKTHRLRANESIQAINSESPAQSSGVFTPGSLSRSVQPQEDMDIYGRFAETYPEYRGDRKHFHNLCKKLVDLQSVGKAQHRSLWDDYIIRHKTDYVPYLAETAAEGGDHVLYEDFYRDQIDEPLTRKRIIGPATLKTALEQSSTFSSRQFTPISGANTGHQTRAETSMPPPTNLRGVQDEPSPNGEFARNDEEGDTKMIDLSGLDGASTPPYHQTTREQAKAYVGTEARSGNHEEEETDSAGDPSAEFWKDYNAPFKEFARGYVNLKSMNGRLGSVDQRDGTVWPPFKRIDTLNWRL